MTPLHILAEVQAALYGLEHALVSGRADLVLAAEAPIAQSAARLAALVASGDPPAARRHDLREAVDDIRRSISRAGALGHTSATLSASLLPPPNYGPRGVQAHGPLSRPSVASRT